MYYLWVLHYSLIKGLYKKRWKEMSASIDGLAFCCLFILSLFLCILFIDKAFLWELIRKRLPLGPFFKGVLVVFVPIVFFLLSRPLKQSRIRTIRKVIKLKSKINLRFSQLYIFVYISMFIFSLVLIAFSRTSI
jgi:hypothetical protein